MTRDLSLLSNPDSVKGRLQRACLDVLEQHEADDMLPTSIRFVFYELLPSGLVSKKPPGRGRRGDQNLCDASMWLRERGIVPWSWIMDETRDLTAWRFDDSVHDYLVDAMGYARIDLWDGEPAPVIITESRSLSGTLNNLAAQYLCPITSTNGQAGGHLHTGIAPALEEDQRVLYLGDWDQQGMQIEANTRSVLEGIVGPLDWERLAVTEEQVRERDLPIIMKVDGRYKKRVPHPAVETEALGQRTIVEIVRGHLDDLLPEPLDDVLEREQEQREEAARLLVEAGP